jgi:hypothetical protein
VYADPLKKVLETKKGTAGDINILLASMLEKAEIQVDMVVLSTRDHGFIREAYPMKRQFNYVVCRAMVNGVNFFLDATEKFLPINTLPERCLNGRGLVISKYRHGWVELQTKTKSKTIVEAKLALQPTGELTGNVNFIRDGYDAVKMRKAYVSKGEGAYVKEFQDGKTWQFNKTEFKNITELDQTPKENHEVSLVDHTSVAGDVIYLSPFVTAQLESNPFVLKERLYPVDFGAPIEKVYVCQIQVPDGYAIDELPKPKVVTLPGNGAKYLYNVAVNGSTISITSNMTVSKNLFLPDEYPYLREFYSLVVSKQAEQIVLKKK